MAGKRIYITIPKHEYELLVYWGVLTQECRGQLALRLVRTMLYRQLQVDLHLQAKEAELMHEERMEALAHGRLD